MRNLGSGNALNLEAGTGQALSILGPGGANPAVNVSVQGNGAGIAVTSGNGPGIAVSGGNGFAIDAVGPADISTIRGRNVYSSCVYIGCNGVQGHSTNGAGVGGYGKLGVYGEGEQGVYGAGDGVGKAGVTGTSNRFGGCSQSSLSTYCYGVIGEATTPSGNTGIGVSGVGTFAGIYGRDTVAGSWAGYFDGRMATRDILPISDNAWFLGNLTHRWNQIHSTNSLQVTSDRRAKKDIADLAYGLNDILKLRPVTFRWNEGTDETTHLGLIAQEVRAIIPEAIHGEESEGMLSMTPDAFIPVLIRAIQEQDREIEGLRAEVRGLTGAASPATFMANNSPTTWPVFAALVMGAMGLICGGSALAVTLRR